MKNFIICQLSSPNMDTTLKVGMTFLCYFIRFLLFTILCPGVKRKVNNLSTAMTLEHLNNLQG